MYVLFKSAFLARLQSVLANVVAVIGRVEDIGFVENAVLGEPADHAVDDLVDCLQSAETIAVEFVVEVDVGLVLFRKAADPGDSMRLYSVPLD